MGRHDHAVRRADQLCRNEDIAVPHSIETYFYIIVLHSIYFNYVVSM